MVPITFERTECDLSQQSFKEQLLEWRPGDRVCLRRPGMCWGRALLFTAGVALLVGLLAMFGRQMLAGITVGKTRSDPSVKLTFAQYRNAFVVPASLAALLLLIYFRTGHAITIDWQERVLRVRHGGAKVSYPFSEMLALRVTRLGPHGARIELALSGGCITLVETALADREPERTRQCLELAAESLAAALSIPYLSEQSPADRGASAPQDDSKHGNHDGDGDRGGDHSRPDHGATLDVAQAETPAEQDLEHGKDILDQAFTQGVSRRDSPEEGLAAMSSVLPEAIVAFTRAIEADPTCAAAYLERANAYQQNDQLAKAIADFTEAIRLAPGSTAAYHGRAFAYELQDEHELARADYDEAIRINPSDANAYSCRADFWDRWYIKNESQPDLLRRAIADYTEAIRLDPDESEYLFSRGSLRVQIGQYREAIADLTQSMELGGVSAFELSQRGEAYLRCGEFQLALKDLTKAIHLDSTSADTYALRAEVHRALGQGWRAHDDQQCADDLRQREPPRI